MQGIDEIEPSKETLDLGMSTPLAAFDAAISAIQEAQARVHSFVDTALSEGAVVFNGYEYVPNLVSATWPNGYTISLLLRMHDAEILVSISRTVAGELVLDAVCESIEAALEGRH